MSDVVFEKKLLMSEVTKKDLPPGENQRFHIKLYESGTFSFVFSSNDENNIPISRICVPINDLKVIEAIMVPDLDDCYTFRINGTALPLILNRDDMTELMDVLEEFAAD